MKNINCSKYTKKNTYIKRKYLSKALKAMRLVSKINLKTKYTCFYLVTLWMIIYISIHSVFKLSLSISKK